MNSEFVNALMGIERNKLAYNLGKPLPVVARMFIEMGKEAGMKIEIEYGTRLIGNDTVAGYFMMSPEKDKGIFIQDIYMEDESDENIAEATAWMKLKLSQLQEFSYIKK